MTGLMEAVLSQHMAANDLLRYERAYREEAVHAMDRLVAERRERLERLATRPRVQALRDMGDMAAEVSWTWR